MKRTYTNKQGETKTYEYPNKSKRKEDYNKFEQDLEKENFTPPENWSHWWLKTDWASIFVKNDKSFDYEAFMDSMIDKMEKYAPKYKKIEYKLTPDTHCLVLDLADHHFWKLSDIVETWYEYNLEVAKDRFSKWVDWILTKSLWFKKDKIIFVIWNDVLHIDNPKRTTTSWTPQDTDWMWHKAFNIALDRYVQTVEKLQKEAPVHIIFNPSNHDYMSWYMLANCLYAWFHNNPNLTWDISMRHRKYTEYGNTMIWVSHWDGAKESDVWILRATERPEIWARTKFRYIYLHHIHHKIAKDLIWVTLEYMRSASSPDRWHSDNWYINKQAVDWFIISKEEWQIARLTHYF